MNGSDLSNFFYNLIPGIVFILGLDKIGILLMPSGLLGIDQHNNDVTRGLVLISIALLLGFFFQGLTKIIRELFLNNIFFCLIKCFHPHEYKKAEEELKELLDKDNPTDKEKFYLMDNYLRATEKASTPIHFSSRFAFWSNLFMASVIYLFFLNVNLPATAYLLGITQFVLFFSLILALFHFYAYYDVVLKSFITIRYLYDKK